MLGFLLFGLLFSAAFALVDFNETWVKENIEETITKFEMRWKTTNWRDSEALSVEILCNLLNCLEEDKNLLKMSKKEQQESGRISSVVLERIQGIKGKILKIIRNEVLEHVFGSKVRCRFRLEKLPQEFVSYCFRATEKDTQILRDHGLNGSSLLKASTNSLEKLEFSRPFLLRIIEVREDLIRRLVDFFFLPPFWTAMVSVAFLIGYERRLLGRYSLNFAIPALWLLYETRQRDYEWILK